MSDPGGIAAVRTIFLGSGGFAVPAAEALARDPRIDLLGVVLAPPHPQFDPANDLPVAQWAMRRQVGMYRPARLRDPAAIDGIARGKPDLLVLADYGQIVPQQILDMPRFGALNLHPSLLPRHRGATPIEAAILEGDTETGVSLIRMDSGLDTGPLVAQRHMPLRRDETAPQLEAILAGVAGELLTESLGPWLAGEIAPAPQPAEGVTLTRPLRRDDGRLDPGRGIEYLDRQIRAFQGWPGTFVETQQGRVKIFDARPLDAGSSRTPGQLIRLPANRLALAARDGLLELVEVQPAGGRLMSGAELLRGRPDLAGTIIIGASSEEDASSA